MFGLFDDPVNLDGLKVSLHPLTLDDIENIAGFALDDEIWAFSNKPIKKLTRDGVEHFVRNLLQEKNIRHGYPFVIVDKGTGKSCGIVKYENIGLRHCRLDIGSTLLGLAYRGKGIMKAAVYLLLEYAFTELEAVRVGTIADIANTSVHKFTQSIGATNEGTLRSYILDNEGEPRDMNIYSIIISEWESVKQKHFAEFQTP